MSDYLKNISPEERKVNLLKAQEARKNAQKERENNKKWLKNDAIMISYWASLASKYKVRMPMEGEATSGSVIRKYLKKLNIDTTIWNEHYTSIKYFVENNSTWSAYATAGLCLELKEEYSD